MATFTALNGGSPKAVESISASGEANRPASAPKRPEIDTRSASEISTSQKEREAWTNSAQDRPRYPSANYPVVEGSPQKRKRSDSGSPTRGEEQREQREQRQYSHSARSETYEAHRPQSTSHDQFGPAHREYRSYGDENRESSDRWPPQHHQQKSRDEREGGYEQPYSAAPTSALSDDQVSPSGDDRSGVYSGHYTPEQRRDGIIQSDPKKRKRNFSNRTKTGCLTCRKRKKKCDEAKPECKSSFSAPSQSALHTSERLCHSAWPSKDGLRRPAHSQTREAYDSSR